MIEKQNAARLGAGGAGKSGAHGLGDSVSDILPRCEPFCNAFNPLLAQAERRMKTDPAHYAEHYLLWLSFVAAKNRWPWPAKGGRR